MRPAARIVRVTLKTRGRLLVSDIAAFHHLERCLHGFLCCSVVFLAGNCTYQTPMTLQTSRSVHTVLRINSEARGIL